MDTSSSTPLLIPRLRLTRLGSNPQLVDGGMSKSPVAGPSRLSPRPFVDVGDDNSENDDKGDLRSLTTPKLTSTTLPTTAGSHYPDQRDALDTPAARLRALLSRVPNDSSSKASEKAPALPSDIDSDFDPPRFSPTTPSVARESLKDLFSHALRDPGDTPKKGRRRRNSIDVSEVEASPRIQRERAKYRSKRRSLSDEEADKPSTSTWHYHPFLLECSTMLLESRSESSFQSSQAATFDALRERLTSSRTKGKSQSQSMPTQDRTFY
jgi:serine/arginine repetitive matrix protein 2